MMSEQVANELGALVLPGTDGKEHRLGDLWASRPVAITWVRHFG
jgi:hypothetical protein